jgi:excisionase family DNA binding protein
MEQPMPVEFERGYYYTVQEAARKGDVSPSYIYKLIREGRIIEKRTPKDGILIPVGQIIDWLSSRRRPGRPKKL